MEMFNALALFLHIIFFWLSILCFFLDIIFCETQQSVASHQNNILRFFPNDKLTLAFVPHIYIPVKQEVMAG